MKYTFATIPFLGLTVGAPVAFVLTNTGTNSDNLPGLAGNKFIEVTFFNKETSNAIEILAKIRIPIKDIKNTKNYQYCKVAVAASSSSGSATTEKNCRDFKTIANNDAASALLANLAQQYMTVQHYTNVMKAKQTSTDDKKEEECKCDCTGCDKDKCCDGACCTGKTCTVECCKDKDKKCCCCVKEITALADPKQFNNSISNMASSYSGLYFSPTNVYIYVEDLKLEEIAAADAKVVTVTAATGTTTTTPTITEETKNLYGSMLYSYIDYYYKTSTTKDLDKWLTSRFGSTTNSSAPSTTGDDKHFINYPMKFTYKMNKKTTTGTSTGSSSSSAVASTTITTCTGTDCDLESAFKKWSDKFTSLKEIEATGSKDSELKKIIDCSKMGEITKTSIANIKNIFSHICACKK